MGEETTGLHIEVYPLRGDLKGGIGPQRAMIKRRTGKKNRALGRLSRGVEKKNLSEHKRLVAGAKSNKV